MLICFLGAPTVQPASGVPALANESIVVGEILERMLIDAADLGVEPAQKLWRFKVRVIKVDEVAGSENFLRGETGQVIDVYGNAVNAPAQAEKVVHWRIRFQGDERSGRYWLIGTAASKSS